MGTEKNSDPAELFDLQLSCTLLIFLTPQRYNTFYNYDHYEMPSMIQEDFPTEHPEKQ